MGRLSLQDLVARHATQVSCIFSDLDGTLLTDSEGLPAGTADVLARLKAAGIHFVATTGRTLWSVAEMFGPLTSDIDVIAGNGMDIVLDGVSIEHIEYDRALIAELHSMVLEDPGQPGMIVYSEDSRLLINMDPEEFYGGHTPHPAESLARRVDALPEGMITKVALLARSDSRGCASRYQAHFGGRLNFAICGDHWVDIPLASTNKALAAARVLKERGLTPGQAIAFGDSMNDAELLQFIPAGVVVSNALPEVKAFAAYEIGHNNAGSVVAALDALLSARI